MLMEGLAVQWKARIKLEILMTLNCECSLMKGFFCSQYVLVYNCDNWCILLFHTLFFPACRYLNAIQTTCPHILRYLTTAVITNKRRRTVLKDLVKVIQQESYTYKDPITEFLECLYVNFDFDGAQQKLRECETVSVLVTFLALCFTFWGFLCTLF